ncbi:hypothetical protein ABZS66_57295 [Dactylosporangium sp. NPDC005572]|uniref:hypothetical protein n=1 Tax=Dactylosporangium sp. NPDC005572 TaxID=3156889 RepID=UPI0033AD9A5B
MRRTRSRVCGLVIAFVAAVAVVFGAAAPASAGNLGSALYRGGVLWPSDYIERTGSGGWTYWLIMQSDANLVLYKGYSDHSATKVCWASNTNGYGWNATKAVYQNDGNLVIYTTISGLPIWGSNSVGDTGTTVDISYYGRLYVGYKQMSNDC